MTTTELAPVIGAPGVDLGTGRYVGVYVPGSPEFNAARARRIGGSEIGAVIGVSPFESYFSLWHRKVGNLAPIPDTLILRMGRRLEDDITEEYELQHPDWELRECGSYVHPERDWQMISPDRIGVHRETGEWIPIEIKYPHADERWGPSGGDDVPVYYRAQVMQAMDVLGIERHILVAYFGGEDWREYLIEYDAEDVAVLRARGAAFIEHVAAAAPLPEIDKHNATYEAVMEMHPEIDGRDVPAPASIAEPFLAARAALAESKEDVQLYTALLADFMGSARRATYGVTKAGHPRSIACRMASNPDATPYLKASPLPKTQKTIKECA